MVLGSLRELKRHVFGQREQVGRRTDGEHLVHKFRVERPPNFPQTTGTVVLIDTPL